MQSVKISELKLNPNNPRLIKDDKFAKLVQSIKDFPEMLEKRPIVCNKDMVILGGNMRLRACKEAGLKEVPVMIADWPEEKQKEFIAKDNIGFGEWDWDIISNEWDIDQLQEWGLDFPLDFGKQEATEDDFDVPPLSEVQTDIVVGDLFQIGEHRILCGDARNANELAMLMNSQLADVVVTDPPYNTGMKGKENAKAWLSQMFDDSFTSEEFEELLTLSFANIKQFTKGECAIYCFIDWRNAALLKEHIERISDVKNVIVWDKQVHGLGSDYKSTYELCIVGKKGKPQINNRIGLDYQDIWRVQRKMGRDEHHATKKPIELLSKPMLHASKEDDIVLDVFGGSGSTMVTAQQLNRRAYLCEIMPQYVQITIDRMLKLQPDIKILRNGKPYVKSGNTPTEEKEAAEQPKTAQISVN